MEKLSMQSIELLKQCLLKHNDFLLWTLQKENEDKLTEEIYNDLRDIVCDELIANGFDNDGSINQYGDALETLIDDIGDIFMK